MAEGQSKRVLEFQQAIAAYEDLSLSDFNENTQVDLTSLVQLSADVNDNHYFFIAPAAGGFRCQLKQNQICLNITVITPSSPMALALIGKQQDDDIEVMLGNNKLTDYIAKVY